MRPRKVGVLLFMVYWADIFGWKGNYQVSGDGYIQSVSRTVTTLTGDKVVPSKVLDPYVSSNGGVCVTLGTFSKKVRVYVADAVARAHLNGIPSRAVLTVEHIDGNKLNNNVKNLRVTAILHPKHKNKPLGVFWHSRACKYQAKITVDGVQRYLGVFDTSAEAHEAYIEAVNDINR